MLSKQTKKGGRYGNAGNMYRMEDGNLMLSKNEQNKNNQDIDTNQVEYSSNQIFNNNPRDDIQMIN